MLASYRGFQITTQTGGLMLGTNRDGHIIATRAGRFDLNDRINAWYASRKPERLVQFIREHGFDAYCVGPDKIEATEIYSGATGAGYEATKVLPAQLDAVRAWLGY